MSAKQIECYVAACDSCGEHYENGDYVVHWDRPEDIEVYEDENWYSGDGKLYCYSCRQSVEHEHVWAYESCEICMEDQPDEDAT